MTNRKLQHLMISMLLLLCAPFTLADGNKDSEEESPKVILPTDFKKCAAKVFKKSTDVTDVSENCEAEMKAYIESRQPSDGSPPAIIAGAATSGSSTSSVEYQWAKLVESYENCVFSTFDKSRSERAALKACEEDFNAYLLTVPAPVREQVSTLVLTAVHKMLARRSLGQES